MSCFFLVSKCNAKKKTKIDWTTDSSLEYRLTLFHAQEEDSGVFVCQTPNLQTHSVEIKVQKIDCLRLNESNSKDEHRLNTNNVSVIIKNNNNDDHRMGSILSFECPIGTTLVGSNSSECLWTAKWSDRIPICNGLFDFV